MTNRDGQLQAYKEYQAAVREAEKKKPEGSWYKFNAEDGSGSGRLIYDPAGDIVELVLPDGTTKVPGKFIKGILSGLKCLTGENKNEGG